PGMGGGAGGGTQATPGGMEMNTDAHTRFDVKKGRLLGVQGVMSIKVNMGGMGHLLTESKFQLERI
ncbi:MAG: hypothetical protein JRF33_27535, partial [Deltaproteobacteria bacterium]|nr:hypothetical protein [Deltaproteobacteria bacterium]